jgi:hypothetical protein
VAKKRSTSTAIARRSDVQAITVNDPEGLLDRAVGQLGEIAHTGGMGLAEIKLTKAEEKIIARPIERAAIMVLPDSGQIYLPHVYYTRWLNDAFSRTGWSIEPVAKPMKVENLIIIPYVLKIHGVAVTFAHGGAEYFEKNKRQTYDDVLEATVAYGLRRCCKRFGMALELWDRRYINDFIELECVHVSTSRGRMWRRKNDPPFDDETKASKKNGKVEAPAAGSDGNGEEKITKDQVKRMVGIWRRVGRRDADVRFWLKKKYRVEATADVKRKDYTAICNALEARGELALPGDGE